MGRGLGLVQFSHRRHFVIILATTYPLQRSHSLYCGWEALGGGNSHFGVACMYAATVEMTQHICLLAD